ncbi:Dyp-type peroxidase [Bailinhaonella thermotolerans]|uniref:Dyp-type peroxidase n=1 Tax=Bailinhaonella thermotolerans TaxID=1070861 RepID=A0A3A4AMF2_9ACTN|nr:Dyp-type peroxidase [Bailinhaonella thermotolerans]RJL30141.1 Dyp-type peroxidase [Bailinhaonella thermotolerans]
MTDLTRRGLFAGGAAAVGALAAGAAGATPASASAAPLTPGDGGRAVEPFHGPHQAGIATDPQAHAAFVAFDLLKDTGREAVVRMLRLLTDDVRRLAAGHPALADTEPELAAVPARLTVTFGFGPGLFRRAGLASPVEPLPPFKRIDRLEERWSGGDLLLQICADDPLTVAHALRMTVKDARSFARVRWVQRGFRRGLLTQPRGVTQRNVMGQVDGTVNPRPGTPEFDRAVWITGGPLGGGTTLVLRRIRAEMETWDAADRTAKEFTVGRTLATGAPLTGRLETDEPDFTRLSPAGFPVIAEYAHVRRARVDGATIFRRVYNYDDGLSPGGEPDTGLLFASFQADVERQFLPIQRSLAEADLLNEWTTPTGSAVFAVPPGCSPGGYVGETLLA